MTEAAPAAAEPVGTPIETNVTPNPVETGNPAKQEPAVERGQPPSGEERKSIDDIIKGAHEKAAAKVAEKEKAAPEAKEPVKAKEDAPKAEKDAKPEPKAEAKEPVKTAERGEDGKFVSKDAQKQPQEPAQTQEQPSQRAPHHEAPARFSADAKAEWEGASESVKAETHRALRELEQGHQKYKADAEQYERLREFDELARTNGRDLKDSLSNITRIENTMKQNPIAGLDMVLRELGMKKADGSPVTLLDVAAHVMNQKPEERAMQQNTTIAGLQAKIAQLEQQFTGVSQSIQQQQQNASVQQVQAFAKDHPRFDELSNDIEFFLKSGRTQDLSEAYTLAERLNPAPAASPQELLTPAPMPPSLVNPAGQKSISGAPSSGSDPAIPAKRKGQNTSIDDALKRAQARLAS